jgi:hypothetical protein
MPGPSYTYVVFDQQRDQLLAVHERHWRGVRPGSFDARSRAEVTGRDDQAPLMGTQTSTHLLDDGRLDVLLPAFDLHSHAGADDIAHNQGAAHVDAAVARERRDRHRLRAEGGQEATDQCLEVGGLHRVQARAIAGGSRGYAAR